MPVNNDQADLIFHVVANNNEWAGYPDSGSAFRGRLQPHCADIAAEESDAYVFRTHHEGVFVGSPTARRIKQVLASSQMFPRTRCLSLRLGGSWSR